MDTIQIQAQKKKLGARMRELRLRSGQHNAEKFAADIDISRVLYSNYEKGSGNVTYKNLLKVVEGIGVPLHEFFKDL